SFWHNSFDAIIDHDPEELTVSVKKQFGAAAMSGGGELPDMERFEVEEESSEHPEVVSSSLKILASIEQGFRLRQDAKGMGFRPKPEVGGKLIMANANGQHLTTRKGSSAPWWARCSPSWRHNTRSISSGSRISRKRRSPRPQRWPPISTSQFR